jgi:hypothetical protein
VRGWLAALPSPAPPARVVAGVHVTWPLSGYVTTQIQVVSPG